MRRRWLLLLVLGALLGASCRAADLELGDAPFGDLGAGRDGVPDDRAAGEVLVDPDEVVAAALADLVQYWTDQLPAVYGVEFEPLEGGYVPYGPVGALPRCGPDPLVYDDIAENAVYCPGEDLIAWDRVALIPALQAEFGALTTGLVMAHEFAHAIQARGDVEGRTLTLELQADCFAGAWVDDVDDRLATFATSGDALELALAGLLELRDTVGVSAVDPEAHGSGFDRIGAFLDGVTDGPTACAGYEDSPPQAVAIPFGSRTDQRQGGNLPLDQLIEPLVADLEQWFGDLVAGRGGTWVPVGEIVPFDPANDAVRCNGPVAPADLVLAGFWCAEDNRVYLDVAELIPELDQIGDFAFGGELARIYAQAAQARLDIDEGNGLHADCLTGAFAEAEFERIIPDQQLVLSPGDLDEIIISYLALGIGNGVTAFDRTAAFRVGFLEGASGCDRSFG